MARALICVIFFAFFALLYPRLVVSDLKSVEEQAVDIPLPSVNTKEMSKDAQKMLTEDDKVMRFLEECYKSYPQVVTTGYKTILTKREWVDGQGTKPNPQEVIEVDFREKPFSVFLEWKKGFYRARRSLYVEGQNLDPRTKKSMMWTRTYNKWSWLELKLQLAVDSELVKASGRYTIDKFGVQWGLKRVLRTWRQRHKEGNLNAKFDKTVKLAEVGNRPCYRIYRKIPSDRPEEDGILEVILYVDVERKLQVGTILKGIRGNKTDALIGQYFFNIVELNPTYEEDDPRFSVARITTN